MRILFLLTLVSLAVFAVFPELDLTVSHLFYTPGEGFTYRQHPALVGLYYGIRGLSTIIIAGLAGTLLAKWFLPERIVVLKKKPLVFLLVALLLGPGIIVHWGFKESWERARPVNIEQFGGTKAYSPPLKISDQGGKSFVSGHAAMGFYMVAFAFLFSGERRRKFYIAGVGFGVLASLGRIVQGGHFLSDTVFAALVTLWVIHGLYWWMFVRKVSAPGSAG